MTPTVSLDTTPTRALGHPIDEYLPAIDPLGSDQTISLMEDGRRREFAATTAPLEDALQAETTTDPVVLHSSLTEIAANLQTEYDGATIDIDVPEDLQLRGNFLAIRGVFTQLIETALEHGSGLGLWLVKWGVVSLGGSIDFEVDDAGTTARVHLPAIRG